MAKRDSDPSIDEKILSKIPGLNDDAGNDDSEGEDSDQDNQNDGDNAGEGEDSAQQDDQSTVLVGKVDRASSNDQQTPATGKPEKEKEAARVIDPKTGKPIVAAEKFADINQPQKDLKTDKKGNLVNGVGEIVARAGSERRMYEKMSNATRQAAAMQQQLGTATQLGQRLQNEIEGMRQVQGLTKELRMSTEEAVVGLKLVDMFKKSPEDFFKYVLRQMTEAGHDVSKMLPEAGASAIDPAGIKSLVEKTIQTALGPMAQTQQQTANDTRIMAEATQEYNDFIARYPDVGPHEDAISRMIQAEPQLTLDAAYYKLQAFVAHNRLDWSLPLVPQIEAARTRQSGQQPQRQIGKGNGGQQPRPMPNGRSGNPPVVQQEKRFTPDSSWDDIINHSMKEAGVTRN